MTTLTLLAHVSGAPHAHAEFVTGIIIALALLGLGLVWRKTTCKKKNYDHRFQCGESF